MDSQTEDSDIPLVLSHPLYRVEEEKFSRIDEGIRSFLGLSDLDICYRFATLAQIHDLNRNYRAKDQPTDVLAFPQFDWQRAYDPAAATDWQSFLAPGEIVLPHGHLGDVVISLEQAAEQAKDLGHDLGREVVFLMIHGTLHLCGHDHHSSDEERTMIDLQKRVLNHLLEQDMQALWQQCFHPKGVH